MAAMFTSWEVIPFMRRLGFDDQEVPPWVMVPAGGTRAVALKDGSGLSLQTRTAWDARGTGVVTFREEAGTAAGRKIVLTGTGPGAAFLEALDAAHRVQATLEITVKERMTLHAFSYFVGEKNGRMTATSLETVQQMVEVTNAIYLPQANIELVHDGSAPLYLPFDAPQGFPIQLSSFNVSKSWYRNIPGPLECYMSRPPDQRGCMPEEVQGTLFPGDFDAIRKYQIVSNLLSHIDNRWDYHIFLVRTFRVDGPFDPLTVGYTPMNSKRVQVNACLIRDSGARGQVLAHEFGHFLLRPGPSWMDANGHSDGVNDLMQEHPALPTEIIIPEDQANYMNHSGVQYGIL